MGTDRVIQRRDISPLETASRLGALVPDIQTWRLERAPEFFASSTDLSRLTRDARGRPLGERWPPPEYTQDVEFDRRRCPYPDGRRGLLMNVSPLGDIGSNWDRVLGMLSALSAAYLAALSKDSHTWLSVWELSKVVCAVPYCANENFIVPTELGALFKPSLGLFMVSEWVVSRGVDPAAATTSPKFLELLSESGTLWFDDSACSGPPRMIDNFVVTALTAPQAIAQDHLSLSGPKSVLPYGMACARLELAKWIYCMDADYIDGKNDGAVSQALRVLAATRGLEVPEFDWAVRVRAAIEGSEGETSGSEDKITTCVLGFAQPWLASFASLQADISATMGRPQDAAPPLAIHDLDHVEGYFWSGWHFRQRRIPGLLERFVALDCEDDGRENHILDHS